MTIQIQYQFCARLIEALKLARSLANKIKVHEYPRSGGNPSDFAPLMRLAEKERRHKHDPTPRNEERSPKNKTEK
jgi:hypothetical protein